MTLEKIENKRGPYIANSTPTEYITSSRVISYERLWYNRLHLMLGFKQPVGLLKNFMYKKYHQMCQKNFAERGGQIEKEYIGPGEEFRKNLYHIFPATKERKKLFDKIPQDLLAELDRPSTVLQKFPFAHRLLLNPSQYQQVQYLLTDEIQMMMKSFFRSDFVVMSSYMFKTNPDPTAVPRSSFLWHLDEHPDCHMKMYFYLTDAKKDSGAIQYHSWEESKKLMWRGFWDRRNVPEDIQRDLDNEEDYSVAEVDRGTVMQFIPSFIHRAVIPVNMLRHVLVFEAIPAPEPNLGYRDCHMKFWEDPEDILSGKLKGTRPDGVDY